LGSGTLVRCQQGSPLGDRVDVGTQLLGPSERFELLVEAAPAVPCLLLWPRDRFTFLHRPGTFADVPDA
jgi:hypothetical protein